MNATNHLIEIINSIKNIKNNCHNQEYYMILDSICNMVQNLNEILVCIKHSHETCNDSNYNFDVEMIKNKIYDNARLCHYVALTIITPESFYNNNIYQPIIIPSTYPLLLNHYYNFETINRNKKKIKCLDFLRNEGNCPYGLNCIYAHPTDPEWNEALDKYKTQKCVHILQKGFCAFGKRCSYVHPDDPQWNFI